MAQLMYDAAAAAGYERGFARISSHFIPFLLRAGHVAPGYRVLDVATGTGLAAEAALAIVGATGHVTAADISPQMAERAQERLAGAPNVSVRVEDGQALTFPADTFDTVLCSLGADVFPRSSPRSRRVPPRAPSGRTRCCVRQHRARALLQHANPSDHGSPCPIIGTSRIPLVFSGR